MSENPPPFNAESVLLDSVNVSSISVLTNSCEVDSSGGYSYEMESGSR